MIFTYYAGIMLDAFLYLLCSQSCQHRPRPGFLKEGRHGKFHIAFFVQMFSFGNAKTKNKTFKNFKVVK